MLKYKTLLSRSLTVSGSSLPVECADGVRVDGVQFSAPRLMNQWDTLPAKKTVEKTIAFLKQNRIDAVFVENGKEAKEKVLSLIPQGSEVFNQTSVTLETIGLVEELNSDRFDS